MRPVGPSRGTRRKRRGSIVWVGRRQSRKRGHVGANQKKGSTTTVAYRSTAVSKGERRYPDPEVRSSDILESCVPDLTQ